MANVKIDCTQIPRVQMDILCRTLLAGIERFYSDPENLRRYEAWLQKCSHAFLLHKAQPTAEIIFLVLYNRSSAVAIAF